MTLLVMPDTTVAGQHATHDGMYANVVALRKGSVGVIGPDRGVVNSVAGALSA